MDSSAIFALTLVTISGIMFALFLHFLTLSIPEENRTYKECHKLQNIKEVYNNLSLEQKDYIYDNCI